MDILCAFLLWMLAVGPAVANSCISNSAVCCLMGEIEGKIFFDEIEGPGCSNRGNVQVIFNLIGLGRAPFYHFRLKSYGEILPACSGLGEGYGYNSGYITALQPLEDGSVYNDTIFMPGATSGYGIGDLIGRSVAVYQGRPTRQPNQRPMACCVIGRGQPVSLPLPSPAKPTPVSVGPREPIDLSVGQQTNNPTGLGPIAPANQNGGNGGGVRNQGIILGPKNPNSNGFSPNNYNYPPTNNRQPNAPSTGITIPGSNNKINNEIPNSNRPNDNLDPAGGKTNPKYTFDEDGIDNKFNLIGGYGDASNFDFDSYGPSNDRYGNRNDNNNNNNNNHHQNNNNNNGDYSNVYNQGNKNFNMNTAGVYGPPNASPVRGNAQSRPGSSNGGRGGGFSPNSNNNNFNGFNGNQNRNRGFGNSQFPSVFGSIGTGNFFNLDGKLAGASLINGDPRSAKGFGQGGDGALSSSLAKGFEPPKGPSFQDIYNKPTGESPLSSGGFADSIAPEEENSISRSFFSDPGIKNTIGLSNDDKFIPRETEDEEESSSYRSQSDSGDEGDDTEAPDFNTDINNLSSDDGYTYSDGGDSSGLRVAPPGDDQIPSRGPIGTGSGSGSGSE